MDEVNKSKSELTIDMILALDKVANAYMKTASSDRLLALLNKIPEDVKDKFARNHARQNVNVFISILENERNNSDTLKCYLDHNFEIIEDYLANCTNIFENISDQTKDKIVLAHFKDTSSEKLLTLFETIPEDYRLQFNVSVIDYTINHSSIFIDVVDDPKNIGKLKDYLNHHPEIIKDLNDDAKDKITATHLKNNKSLLFNQIFEEHNRDANFLSNMYDFINRKTGKDVLSKLQPNEISEEKVSRCWTSDTGAIISRKAVPLLPDFLTDRSLQDVQNDNLSYTNGIIKVDQPDIPEKNDVYIHLLISKSTRMNQHTNEIKLAIINLLQAQLNFKADVKIKIEVVTFGKMYEFQYKGTIKNTLKYLNQYPLDLDENKQNLCSALIVCIDKCSNAPLEFILIIVDNDDDNNKFSTHEKNICSKFVSNCDCKIIIVGTDASGIGYELGIPRENCFTSEFLIDGDFGNALDAASKYILIERDNS